jgi:tetrahydromethanopterin S-methyltransferase subunit G
MCQERIKKGAVKCKHCHSFLDDSRNENEGFNYLENGFAKIEEELDNLEEKVNIVIGAVFKRHKYSAEDLLDSGHMNKIKSFAGKIRDDVSRWEEAGRLPFRLKTFYNKKAEEVHERLSMINRMIQERQLTLWEKVGEFFKRFFNTVLQLLPLMFRKLLAGNKQRYFAKAA